MNTIFLDRDGVVSEVVLRGATVSSPREFREFKIRQDFIDFYNSITKLDVQLFVVSNQPDISRELLSEDELALMDRSMRNRFSFKEVVYCRHDDFHNCECRKPKPGMLERLIAKYKIDRAKSVMIGDSWRDTAAGTLAEIRTIYLRSDYNAIMHCQPDLIVDKLLQVSSELCI